MPKLFKRWLVYFLIPAGIVFLFIPLNTHKLKDVQKDFVFFRIIETFTSDPRTLNDLQKNIQKNTEGYPIVPLSALDAYPIIKSKINDMMRLLLLWRTPVLTPQQLNNFPVSEWKEFQKEILGSSGKSKFQVGNSIFQGAIKTRFINTPVEIKGLKMGIKFAGAAFLLLSIFLLRGIYGSYSEGIQIGKVQGIIIWDVIIVLVGIIFTWWFLDFLIVKIFNTEVYWGDEMCGLMGIFWVAFVNPFMALITTATASQTLVITQEEISLKGLLGKTILSWSEVKSIEISEFFVPRKVDGMVAPHKASKVLLIKGKNSSLRIMEPPFASTKKEICSTLEKYAPEGLRDTILNLSKEWVSLW